MKIYKAQNEGTDHNLLLSMCAFNQVMNELDPLVKEFLERSGLMLHVTSEFKYLSDSNRKVFLEIITKYYWKYLHGDHPDHMEIRSECLSSSCWGEIKKKPTTPRFLKETRSRRLQPIAKSERIPKAAIKPSLHNGIPL